MNEIRKAVKEHYSAASWTRKTIFTRAHRMTRDYINYSIANSDLSYSVVFSQALKEVYKEVKEAKTLKELEGDWALDLTAKLNRFRGDMYTREWKKTLDDGRILHRLYITELSGRRRFDGGFVHMTQDGLEYVDKAAKHPGTIGKRIREVAPNIIWV